jgi:hypothetical protein
MEHPFVIDLAETVLALGRREATGALRVAVGHQIRLAFFEKGDLVYFVSDVPEEPLGPALAREGRLATTEARAALALLERQVSRKRSLVTLILETSLCPAERLRSWLVEHAFECFGHALDSTEGTARFAEGIRAEHPLPFSVPATTLILEGVRRMRNDAIIKSAVGPLDYAVDPAPDHVERIQPLSLSFYDGLVASQITQPYVLADLLDVLGLPEPDVLRALLALRCVGVLNPFIPHQLLSDSGRLKTDTGRLRTESGKLILDSGRLRMLLEPDEHADEAVATAVARALDVVSATEDAQPSEPVPMNEYEQAVPARKPVPPPVWKVSAPPANPPRRRRGNTAQLSLLASAYRQMADKEIAEGNVAAAVRYYEAALAQCPENVELVIGLADLLAHRPGGEELGEKLLRKACDEHKTDATPRIALAKLLRAMGRASQAQQLLDEARLLDPENIELRALPAEKQGGFFARLLGGAHEKGSAGTSSSKSGRAALSSTRCRHCGAMCRAGAAACVRCGATL